MEGRTLGFINVFDASTEVDDLLIVLCEMRLYEFPLSFPFRSCKKSQAARFRLGLTDFNSELLFATVCAIGMQVREITAIFHPTQNSRKETGGFQRGEGIVGIGSEGVFGTMGKGDRWISRSSDSPFTGECLDKPGIYRAPHLVWRDLASQGKLDVVTGQNSFGCIYH
jgi:hypothetical protein